MSWAVLLFAFVCGFLLDVIWTHCVASVQHRRALAAANYSALLYLCTIVSTILIVEKNIPAVTVYVIGGWIGTYFAVRCCYDRLR